MEMLSGLVIRAPWISKILDGSKTWEIRGTRTAKRGRIALIEGGTGTVVGVADLVDVVGPLTHSEFVANARKAGMTNFDAAEGSGYTHTFAWVLNNAERLKKPVSYKHPSGAVIWVSLEPDVEGAVLRQVTRA